ncbi:MAG: FG-GAP-like repeat-containing protein [Candidatus Cloacimonetes bacterium]|nr:FG-GAP-like repeat-containing protein [Candidatus Cloacimonadota bacterium]
MKKAVITAMLTFSVLFIWSQEIFTIDNTGTGDFSDFSSAIAYLNDLNEIPVDGVILNVTADQVFEETPDTLTAVASEEAPIIFQKSGTGENPVIHNPENIESLIQFFEAAWITFDGINLADPIADDTLRFINGYYINASDHITIRNCSVIDFDQSGIYARYASTNTIIENNDVYYTEEYFTTQSTINGIKVTYNSEAENAWILNNRVWGLKAASSTVYGIEFNQVTGIAANNFISLTADNNDKIYGIRATGRSERTMEVYHNTVYLNGTATDEGYAIGLMGGGGNLTVRNNIFINDRPDEFQYSAYIGVIYPGMFLDNNVYYNETAAGFRGKYGTYLTDDLPDWQGIVQMDSASVVYEVDFADTDSGDLHIAGSSLGNMALSVSSVGIIDDIDYENRPEENLYCGADENIENPITTEMLAEYTIDSSGNGDFVSFTEAVAVLNDFQVPEGGTVFHVTSGQHFSEAALVLSGMGSESGQILFQKAGTGENPVIENAMDLQAMVTFAGASWITFDGIDIADPLPSDDLRLENAVHISASVNITMRNCHIADFADYGIHISEASVNLIIENNEIYYSDDYYTDQSTVSGIYVQFDEQADNVVIRNNRIYGLKEASEDVYGIRIENINADIYNNFISLSHDNNALVYGLHLDGDQNGLQIDVQYNSVYLAGIAADNGYCFYRSGSEGLLNVQNNILINERSGGYDHLVYYCEDTAGDWNANYNACYSANGRIGDWGNTQCSTLAEWQTASQGDYNSVYIPVEFAGADDLHLAGASLGDFDLAGIALAGITTDIDGETRHSVNPYMGADENLDFPLNPEEQYVINVNPLQLNFGDLYSGTISPVSIITVQNAGSDILTVWSITAPEGFSISLDGGEFVSSIDEFELEVGVISEISVIFNPAASGQFSADIDIHSNAVANEHVFVQVTGNALQPGISISPQELEFRLTATGVVSTPQLVTIYNTGSLPLLLDSITLAQNFAVQIDTNLVTYLTNITLVDSLHYDVVFFPQETGDISGDMVIHAPLVHGAGQGDVVSLNGSAFDFQFTNQELEFAWLWYADSKWGDFDNDGDLDILTSGYQLDTDVSQLHIYENNGNMTFNEYDHEMDGVGNGTVEWIDFDNDGDLDIFAMGQNVFEVYIARTYRNDEGIFTEIENDILPLKSCDSDWGDYDADGDYDLLVMGDENIPDDDDIPHVTIYANDGYGNFTFAAEVTGISSGEAAFGDYDNDGDLDVGVSGRIESWVYTTKIFRNDDNVNFTEIEGDFPVLRYSDVAWGDYDNDGDLDFLVSGSFENESPSEIYLFRNDGNDTFVDAQAAMLGIRQGDIVWGDLDQDGDLDVIVNGIHDYTSWIGYIYLNQGLDEFTLVDSVVSLKYADMVLGDADNDNDLDLFLTGRYDYLDYRVILYENEISFTNTTPLAPAGLTADIVENNVTLSWDAGDDAETGTEGLSYNLWLGNETGNDDYFPALADLETGYREVARFGNAGKNLSYTIHDLPQGIYYAQVQAIDTSHIGSVFCPEISFEITWTAGDENLLPAVTELKGNYPNPFNPETTIEFTLAQDENVELIIYNLKGQKVKTLVKGKMEAADYSIIWDGSDEQGNIAASGVYLYRMHTESCDLIRKMTLLK